MPITLEQAKVGMANKVDQNVIDEFRRASFLLDSLIFDDAVSPGTGGSTLAYGYVQLKTPSTAGVRDINSEYTADEAIRESKSIELAVFGGAYEVDRVIAETSGAVDEISFQMKQKIKATVNEFHNVVINGTKAKNKFDGLKVLLTGSSNELTTTLDISTSEKMDTNQNALLDELDKFVSLVDGTPTMLLMNSTVLGKIRSVARRAGYYERTKDDFGHVVEKYNGIPMVDTGKYYDSKTKKTVDVIADSSIYAICIGLDGFHGVSPKSTKALIRNYLPDLNTPGAVKKGEVEIVAGVVLKNTLKAAKLSGLVVAPAA